jgi:hypothetical protein
MMRLLALAALFCASQAQAAISFVACASTEAANSTSWTVNLPAVTNGDVLIFAFGTETTGNASGTPPTGVSLILQQVGGTTDSQLTTFRKVASSEGATLAFPSIWANAEQGLAVVCAYQGVDNTTPLDVAAVSIDTGSVTSYSGPAIVPVTNGAMVIQILAADPNATFAGTDDASPDATERAEVNHSVGGTSFVYWQDYLQPTAASLALDVTALNSDSYAAAQVALRPAAGGGGGGTAVAVIRQVNP